MMRRQRYQVLTEKYLMTDVYDVLVEDDGRKTLKVKNFGKRYWNDEITEVLSEIVTGKEGIIGSDESS
jgi:hypothetical protein